MSFVQTMSVRAPSRAALRDLITLWHAEQHGIAPGYQGAQLLENLDEPGRYLVLVDFSSREEAERNNTRPETAAWAEKLGTLIEGQPAYTHWRRVTDART